MKGAAEERSAVSCLYNNVLMEINVFERLRIEYFVCTQDRMEFE